ncbi:MAG: AMP-binding protein, partial [Synechococcales cyanobacterium RU_4_20]|nr:AMP-binding protein [Synechococcales cyanobacterium RU_4_20]
MTENEKSRCAVASMVTGTATGTVTDMITSTATDTSGSGSGSLHSDSLHSERLHSGGLLDRNATTRDWPLDRCIPELFEAQVARTPDAVALIYDQQQLTYDQLNRRANQLAHHLRSQGVQAESLVGICIDRSFDLFIGLLAILKAGGAYLPLDPNYPAERLAVIVEDAQPVLLLGQRQHATCLPDLGVPRIWIEDWGDGDRATFIPPSDPNPAAQAFPEQNLPPLAPAAQSGLHHLHLRLHRQTQGGHDRASLPGQFLLGGSGGLRHWWGDRVLQFSTINFDLSVEQIFPYLISGGSLALRTPSLTESIPQFLACCDAWGVTVLDLPTAYWNLLIAEMVSGGYPLPRSIRRAIII